ncbi:MAG: YraN family protein [Candidatus Omnitrophica bacterium CG02_land_8_20_14_3_00__42_8]|nr:MAG: YraN family protein [Candidatus Omnitrophica bacterium CG02_land_8_20_14_3_00__42_8]
MKKLKVRGKRKELGQKGEETAALYLRRKGYKIIEQNYRYSRLGEIDLIAQEGKDLVFVEVKTRSSLSFAEPEEAVNYQKQKRIIKLAQGYLLNQKLDQVSCRFDVVSIIIDQGGKIKSIKLIRDAFGE